MSRFQRRFLILFCGVFVSCGLLQAQSPTDATWQLSTIPYGKAVSTDGTGNSSKGHDRVQLVVNCTNGNNLFSTLLIPGPLMTYPGNDYANATTYDPMPKLGRLQIATSPEIKFLVDANEGEDSPHKLTIAIPNSFYRADLAGKAVTIKLLPPLKNQDEHVVLSFVLPADPSPMLSVAKLCFRGTASQKRPTPKN